jgi:hypothetical protein
MVFEYIGIGVVTFLLLWVVVVVVQEIWEQRMGKVLRLIVIFVLVETLWDGYVKLVLR